MRLKFTVGILLYFITLSSGISQDILNHRLKENEIGQPLAEYLYQIEKGSNNRFFFLDKWFDGISFEKGYEGMRLEEALKKILQGTDISFTSFYGYAIVFTKDPNRTLEKMEFVQSIKTEKKTIEIESIGKKENSKPGSLIEL